MPAKPMPSMEGGLYGLAGVGVVAGDGCRALWAAVLAVAIQDAIRGQVRSASGRLPGDAPPAAGQDEAIRFLTDRAGRWAEARELVADAAGVDPNALREHAAAALRGERNTSFFLTKRRGPDLAPRARPTPGKEAA
ncbi:hypothetical protein [Roseomonas populi]|uniref:Uncharacterized protein n=1 Tax=Roseomonas populi TaxID=3121582 RepID=A0ABT1X127_9PROT|nr:hypothetical protein [Roseomonas pecuniae]MCR0981810.1 hypothetical protein [Roseomonas pecuniae]